MGILTENQEIKGLTFLDVRTLFLRSLLRICDYSIEIIENKCLYARTSRGPSYYYNSNPELKLYTLAPDSSGDYVLSPGEYCDGYNINPAWNVRDILLSEGVIELEKGKDFFDNIKATIATCESLIKFNLHFAVFYASGMRTPHIHIYDLFPNCSDWAEKELSMALFCRKVVPFEYFHYLDVNLFGQHTIALEFSKHYRTQHMNKLIFEHIPGVSLAARPWELLGGLQ